MIFIIFILVRFMVNKDLSNDYTLVKYDKARKIIENIYNNTKNSFRIALKA